MLAYTAYIFEKGVEQGQTKERMETIFTCIQAGYLEVSKGAEVLGITEDELVQQMTEAGYKISTTV